MSWKRAGGAGRIFYHVVHQIKTPIAALRLLLAEEEDERSQEMWEELFSIEQYVEMALQFPDCLRKVRIL